MIVPGQFNVSQTGAATYTIPISVPPGTAGMVPALSLNYSSQSGDGLEGIGWTLSGLPSISRCPRTLAQDGVHGSVNYDANDRFCLDGQRLMLVSGSYGVDGSTYRTEIDSFSNIIAHGSAGVGPAWFEVHTKSGQIMQFGNSVDAQILVVYPGAGPAPTARAWAVNRISDTVGNYLTVTYNCAPTAGACTDPDRISNGEAYPLEIDYTGNGTAGVAPYNSVKFSYSARSDFAPLYQAGGIVQNTEILTDIVTNQSGQVVYDYHLGYRFGISTTHSRLTSVALCDGSSPQNCLNQTTFTWQGGTGYLAMTGTGNGATQGDSAVGFDFFGTGITAVLDLPLPSTCPPYYVYPGPSFTPSTNYPFGFSLGASTCYTMGQVQTILAPNGASQFILPIQATYDDGSFSTTDFLFGAGQASWLFNATQTYPAPPALAGDFNGDGLTDYFLQQSPSGYNTSYIFLGQANQTFQQDGGHAGYGPPSVLSAADFDGDGCTDLLIQNGSASTVNYATFYCHPAVATGDVPSLNGFTPVFGDFNGDGKTDVLLVAKNAPAKLWLSTGTGFTYTGASLPSDWGMYQIYVGDWNGDGKADILLVAPGGTGFYGQGTSHKLYVSTGTGFTPAVDSNNNPITIANNAPFASASVADWNNDGATDIWLKQPVPQTAGDTIYTFAYQPELITAISNGVGSTVNVSYLPLNTNGSFYAKGTSAVYPTQDIDGALYVVSRVDASNGLGTCNPAGGYANCYSSSYSYAGAQTDLRGRGFLGFSTVSIRDIQTNVLQTTNYRTDFPYVGLIASQTKTHTTDGRALNSISNTPANNTGCDSSYAPPGSGIYIVCVATTVAASNDLNGAAFPSTTTNYTYDQFGNALTVDISVSDGSSKNTTNAYTSDTTNWFLGRLNSTTVASTVGLSAVTRQSSFAYNMSTGLLTQETIEPGVSTCNSGSDPCTVTTTYGYDAFGHRISTQVSGSGITTRTSFASYDSRGEFQISATNALGQQESWAYDPRFGSPTAHTGPNLLSTFWTYDSFGRRTLETRPDGTQTKTSYAYCAGSCPAYAQFDAQSEIYAPDGMTQAGPISTTYYDMLSRAVDSDTQGFDGSNIRVETDYNGNGQVLQTSRPYFTIGGTPEFTVMSYDALGRVTQSLFPDSSKTQYGFNGLVASVENNLSQTTTTTKNAQGLIASVQDAAGKITSYVYDAFGNVLTITDPAGNVVQNSYDIRGNKYQSDDPDLGVWKYSHDVLGELASQTDNKGQTTTLTYGLLGRALTRTESGLYSAWTYGTSSGHHNVGQLIEAKACTDSTCSTLVSDRTLSYDGFGRPSASVLHTPTDYFGYATAYNATNGKIATVQYPSGFVEQFVYNQFGYVCYLTNNSGTPACGNPAGAQVFFTLVARDAELHLTQSTAGNGVATTQTFSPLTGLIQNQVAGTSGSVASFSYNFDTIGNLTSRTDSREGLGESFCYDALNRLTNYATNAPCLSGATVTYDSTGIGNIISKSDVGTYAYPAPGPESVQPHAVSAISGTVDGLANPQYSYDRNGNLTCISTGASCSGTIGKMITLTSFNMATSITQGATTVSFSYDSEHKRLTQTSTVSGTTTTTTYLNDPVSGATSEKVQVSGGRVPVWIDYLTVDGNIIAQRQSAYAAASAWGFVNWGQFYWGPPAAYDWAGFNWGAAPWSGSAPNMSYFVLDHLGSVAVVTDQNGYVTNRLSYDPWGQRRYPNGSPAACGTLSSSTTRGFTNQEELDAVCLVNLNARIYDPSIGKFMSADPVVGNIYQPNALNRYAYVLNNPLSFTDTTGLCFLGCFWTSPIFGAVLDIALVSVGLPELEGFLGIAEGATLTEQIASLGVPMLLANGAIAGAVSAGVTGGNVLKGAAFGALQAGLFNGAGDILSFEQSADITILGSQTADTFVAHGIAGGIVSVAQGGNFGSGFLAAGVSSLADSPALKTGNFEANLAEHAVLGGAGSILGGGKFANGAVTGSFGYLFNSIWHSMQGTPLVDDQGNPVFGQSGGRIMVPTDVSPHFFTDIGFGAWLGTVFSGDFTSVYDTLLNFKQGGAWDIQRVGPMLNFNSNFVDFSTVAIGLYGAAAGIPENVLLSIQDAYAAQYSHFSPFVEHDQTYTHLPAANVFNTHLGYTLFESGRIGY